jgi:type II secretion system protein N
VIRRVLIGVALAAAVFVVALWLTFPTDAVVRWALERVTPPGGPGLFFRAAHLRPWGLRLDDVALRRPDASVVAALDEVTIRPSLAGLLDGRSGRPWRASAAACGGTLDATIDRDADGDVVRGTWRDVDLGRCAWLSLVAAGVAGITGGDATVRPARATGEGNVAVRDARWTGIATVVPAIPAVRIDAGTVAWALADGRLGLTTIEAHGPDIEARGAGTVALAQPPVASTLDVALAIAPGRGAPPALRELIAGLPGAPSAGAEHRIAVRGRLDAPFAVAAP